MFFKRLLLALSVGFGLSLCACTGEQDSDFATDTPEKQPMDGNQGGNGGPPAIVGPCLRGIALGAWYAEGRDNGWLNTDMGNVTCAGNFVSGPYDAAADAPSYYNRPLDFQPLGHAHNYVIHNMVWSGVAKGESVLVPEIDNGGSEVFAEYFGEGFIDHNWADTPITDLTTLSTFMAVNLAKLNPYPTSVPVFLDGRHIAGEEPQGSYTVLETIIVADCQLNGYGLPVCEHHIWKQNLPAAECDDPTLYYNQRLLIDPITGQTGLAGTEVRSHNKIIEDCTDESGNPTNVDADVAYCLGLPVVKVWVQPGALASVPGSACEF